MSIRSTAWAARVRATQSPQAAGGGPSLAELLSADSAPRPAGATPEAAAATASSAGDYYALQLERTGDPVMALTVRSFHPRFQTPERYLMPYPQLLHVYALGDNSVTLHYASMAFTIQGAGIADPLLEAINDRRLKAIQQWHAARWPAPAAGALRIDSIQAIDPQALLQGHDAERSA